MGNERICLSMIVKDEAPVIERCLASVLPLIDYWVVCDTGSTDGTQQLVQTFFAKHGKPGELHERPWKDFAHNRTEALALSRAKADYSLIIDADDTLEIPPDFRFPELTDDSYYVDLRDSATLCYQRMQLFRNSVRWYYRGVLHEFPQGEGAQTVGHLPLIIRRNHDGARRKDPSTYNKDAAILEAALRTETDAFMRARYAFYLAQSYRDCRHHEKALHWYLARAEMGFWQEEVFVSLLQAGREAETLQHPQEEVLNLYRRAIEAAPHRAEAAHGASRYCRVASRNREGMEFARGAIDLQPPKNGLFVEEWIYSYGLLDELSVNAYWAGEYRTSLDAAVRALASVALDEGTMRRVTQNMRFAVSRLRETGQPDGASAPISKKCGEMPRVLVAILAKNSEGHLPKYLSCIEGLNYPTHRISLYVRTNNNTDATAEILRRWLDDVRSRYHTVDFDDSNFAEQVQNFDNHDWNPTRFSVLGRIRQASLERALALGCDFYFVADTDNFMLPDTLRSLVNLNLPISAPLLKCVDSDRPRYSNYHHEVDDRGYFKPSQSYDAILDRVAPGLHEVAVVHCTYLVRRDLIPNLTYRDQTDRHEYVIFAESARNAGVPQFIDNRQVYGFLTFGRDSSAVAPLIHCEAANRSVLKSEESERPACQEVQPTLSNWRERPAEASRSCWSTGPIRVINLDRSTTRWETFRRRNSHLGCVERFSAIDGSKIDVRQLREDGIIASDLEYDAGTIGCALSHISLWRQAAKENTPLTIFEDDTLSHSSFFRVRAELSDQLPQDWDLVLWGYVYDPLFVWVDLGFSSAELRFYDRKEPFEWTDHHSLMKLKHAFGTQAYSISPKGARKFLEALLPLRKQLVHLPGTGIAINNEGIDSLMNGVFPASRCYICTPPLVVHSDDGKSDRTP
jgi:GR25 family glycosyltransferase involved in LPS biosynthesis/glycosyltransferase involved in cell wall biosynthesis